MKFFLMFFFLIIITQVFVGITNYIFVHFFKGDIVTFGKTLLYASPFIFFANVGFLLYFNIGMKSLSFGVLYILSLGIGVTVSLLIQYFIFKQNISTLQIIGLIIVLIGLIIMNWKKIFG